jgi:2-desacetyl-2-hydroxyethyl bacteriochlorophyllide A dehydrogenase
MKTLAVVLDKPEQLRVAPVALREPGKTDIVVETDWTGISTGTEKLLYTGRMPPFPGLEYPLVPGYECTGRVIAAGAETGLAEGQRVFVPGSHSFTEVRGLFGGSAARLVADASKVVPVNADLGENAVLLALAATAHHAVTASPDGPPQLVVGHGVLGRLIARIVIALGAEAPLVWETAEARCSGAQGYQVIAPHEDATRGYKKTQIIAIYGKGGIGKILHAGQPQPHDGAAGQARAADRLRPEIRHHLAAVRRQGLPDDHRDLDARRNSPAKRSRSATSASSATASSPWSWAARSRPRLRRTGIIHGFELLEKLGFHDWDFDYVLLDFLGDVVCGGFGLPIARDMCQKVIVVGSNDLQSLYVANNVCSAVEYFRKLGGNVGVAGLVINKDDGTGRGAGLRRGGRHPVLASIPPMTTSAQEARTTRSSAPGESQWGALFAELGDNVAEAPPMRPSR